MIAIIRACPSARRSSVAPCARPSPISAFFQHHAAGVRAGKDVFKAFHLLGHVIEHVGDGAMVQPALAVAARKAEPGERRQPFLQFAVEPALPVADEQFQQPDHHRSGQAEQRRRKRRAHARKLGAKPAHQFLECLRCGLAILGRQCADCVHDARNRGGQAKERAQKPQEYQKVGDIAGKVARLVDAAGDGFKDRPGRRV
jgi:ribosomal protein L32